MILFYLLFPFLGFLDGIKNFYKSNKRAGLLIFAFFFGYSVYFFSGDVLHYRDDFALFERYTLDDFITGIFTFNKDPRIYLGVYNSKPDIFALSIGFIVSGITENSRWFFALISLIYVFLFLKFYDQVRAYIGFKNSFGYKLFSLAIILIVPFYVGVTGVRFWTALFVFLYFIMLFVNTKKKLYLVLSALSILFHYTFFFPVFIAFFTYLINLNKYVLKGLIIIGAIYAMASSTTNSLQFVSNSLSFLDSEQIDKVSSGYLDEDSLEERQEGVAKTNWYVQARVNLLNLFFFTFFILDYFEIIKWKVPIQNDFFRNFYHLFFIVAVFTFNLGSIGRFVYVFYFLILIRILMIQYSSQNLNLKKINYVFLPILILHIFVICRGGFYYVDPLLLISPSVILFLIQSERSLSEFLVGH